MPRPLREASGDVVYHVLNRANARVPIFEDAGDYKAFEQVLAKAHEQVAMRTLAYCVMPSHWHLVLWPRADGDLSKFMHWLTTTHVHRWHAYRRTEGYGHLYQSRFKSFPVQSDGHLFTVCRYVERNALRAQLVTRAEAWRWCSLFRREFGDEGARALLSDGPMKLPEGWVEEVNLALPHEELTTLRACIARGRPFGNEAWVRRIARRLGLESTLRPRGRPGRRRQQRG